jgi:hypothetical protein
MLAATGCGLSLAAGIPLLGLTALPHTEDADGYILRVDQANHTIVLHDIGTTDRLRGQDVLIHLPEREGPRIEPGGQPFSALRPGQRIHTRISVRSHWAHTITLYG